MEESAIRVRGLGKSFGSVRALDAVSFDVGTATVFGLLGPNGAGKTTAVRILATLLDCDAGSATVLGLDVSRRAGEVRRHIGLAGQYATVDRNLTGRENLRLIGRLGRLPRRTFRSRADALLERFDLVGAADRPVREYSGGMRRRLDIAAALVTEPAVLFLDEPTTGLDLAGRNRLWEMIGDLVESGTTVVLTTQYLEEADLHADRVAVIDRGRVIADGTPAALKQRTGSTVYEFGLDDDTAVRAATVLSSLDGVRVERHDSTVTLSSAGGPHLLMEAVRVLDEYGVVPDTLQVRAPTLDDAFLRLTGQQG